jgi:hypothetical protein
LNVIRRQKKKQLNRFIAGVFQQIKEKNTAPPPTAAAAAATCGANLIPQPD